MVTRNDVAKLAKVSPAVVSYVINNSNYVSEEKRQAVLKAIKELNYIPNQNAKNLRQGRSHQIAVIRGSQLNDLFNDLLSYMEEIAFSHNYQLVSFSVQKTDDFYAKEEFIDSLISRQYDAIFIANSSLTEPQINRLSKFTKILLYVTRDYNTLDRSISMVVPHYRKAVREYIGKLISMGHRRICILPNLAYPMVQHTPNNHRYAGYMDAFADHHLPIDMQYIPGSFKTLGEVSQYITDIFNPKLYLAAPTAICADEPFVLARVLKQLVHMGYQVPRDVSLLSFSSSTLTTVTTPQLSTLGMDPVSFAKTSMEMLESLIDNGKAQTQILDLSYMGGHSVAPPPA